MPRPNVSLEELAYFAGFFDGEGSVGIYARAGTRSHSLDVRVKGTDPGPLFRLQEAFDGSIHNDCGRKRRDGYERRPIWDWHIVSGRAVFFLKSVLPYLMVKKGQAELAIEFHATRLHTGGRASRETVSDDLLEKRNSIASRIKAMKREVHDGK